MVHILGAGHVGRALAAALALLPVRLVLVDSRAEELGLAPAGIETLLTPLPEEVVRRAAPGAAFVVLTHDHALDFLIVREALARGDAAYVGMIGSRSKRVQFLRWMREAGAGRRRAAGLPDRGGGAARQTPRGDRGLRGGRDPAAHCRLACSDAGRDARPRGLNDRPQPCRSRAAPLGGSNETTRPTVRT